MKRKKIRPLSLKARVMLCVASSIGMSLILIGYLIQNTVSNHFVEQDEEELIVITGAVETALKKAIREANSFSEVLSEAVSGHHGVYYQVRDSQNRIIYFTAPFSYDVLPNNNLDTLISIENKSTSWEFNGKHYRGLISPATIGDIHYIIVAAIEMEFHMQFLNQFNYTLLLIMAIAAVVILIAAWFGIHQGHLPLYKLADEIASIKADNLEIRIDSSGVPDELISLVNSFNNMLSRLQLSFNQLSNYSDDIAHELRTPLTNLITQTQVVLNKPRSDVEYKELLYSNLEEQERLSKMVNDMLWLAKSDNGLVALELINVDLKEEILACFDFFEALANEVKVTLSLQGDSIQVAFDKIMLRRALYNLVSNAIRHTKAGDAITVRIYDEKNTVSVVIENPGEQIPKQHLMNIFDRFYRIDPSRRRNSEGAGLGLAIVKSILELHGGGVDVNSNSERTQFVIKIRKF